MTAKSPRGSAVSLVGRTGTYLERAMMQNLDIVDRIPAGRQPDLLRLGSFATNLVGKKHE